jgi:hypothetical protein
MDAEQQQKWDAWCDARIETRVVRARDAVADVLGEFQKQNDDAITALRREIAVVRDAPPLFAAPDKKLSAAMVRLGDSLHATSEGIEVLRSAVADCAKRSDLGGVRQRLEKQIAELEERSESNAAATAKNLHAIVQMITNTLSAIERLHCLVARVAVASENADALRAVDEYKLKNEEKPSAVVLRLEDLRQSA